MPLIDDKDIIRIVTTGDKLLELTKQLEKLGPHSGAQHFKRIYNKYFLEDTENYSSIVQVSAKLHELHNKLISKPDPDLQEQIPYVNLLKQAHDVLTRINQDVQMVIATKSTTGVHEDNLQNEFLDKSKEVSRNLSTYLVALDENLKSALSEVSEEIVKMDLETVRYKIVNNETLTPKDIDIVKTDPELSMIMVGRELLYKINTSESISSTDITKHLYEKLPKVVQNQFKDSFADIDEEKKDRLNHLLGIACVMHALQATKQPDDSKVFCLDGGNKNLYDFIRSYESRVNKKHTDTEANSDTASSSSTISSVFNKGLNFVSYSANAVAATSKAIITSTIKPEALNLCSYDPNTKTFTINVHFRGNELHRNPKLFPDGAKSISIQLDKPAKVQGRHAVRGEKEEKLFIGIGEEPSSENKNSANTVSLSNDIRNFNQESSVLSEYKPPVKVKIRERKK